MKEIVVISGKGGTGKTTVSAALATLAGPRAIIADCDVDAADLHLLLQPDFAVAEDFFSGETASINPEVCISCGKCAEVCRFDAIRTDDDFYTVDPLSCEGCGYCSKVCPVQAITNHPRLSGQWFISKIKTGSSMVHARLGIGADNSGKLVAKVKNEAKALADKELKEFIITDGSPGIGCPVVSSLSGAHYVVLVTEPTVSGLHDLIRVYEVVRRFRIPAGCIINKADLNPAKTDEIKQFLREAGIAHLADIPFHEAFVKAIVRGKTIPEFGDASLTKVFEIIWEQIQKKL